MKVAISTVGCRANQADSAAILRHLDPEIAVLCDEADGVDVAILNTCTVTGEADRDCRKRARRLLKASPSAQIFVVGCAVNVNPDFGREIDPRVVPLSGTEALPESLARRIHGLAGGGEKGPSAGGSVARLGGRTRGLIKIQTGCSHGCAYCIVPKARGKERSVSPESILAEIDQLKEMGYTEAVITGVQLGAWGKDLGMPGGLPDMLVRIADRFAPGRIRVSSVEPWSADDAFLETVLGHERICPHFHLPLQNGDDEILRAMRRGYDSAFYLKIAEKIHRLNPDAALGTDVILGFPGEDDAAFSRTEAVLKEIAPAYVHAFTYSPRKGTRAAALPDRPPKEVARARTRRIREAGDAFVAEFQRRHLGQVREIVVEEERDGAWFGLTDTFVKVRFSASPGPVGTLVSAKIVTVENGRAVAETVN